MGAGEGKGLGDCLCSAECRKPGLGEETPPTYMRCHICSWKTRNGPLLGHGWRAEASPLGGARCCQKGEWPHAQPAHPSTNGVADHSHQQTPGREEPKYVILNGCFHPVYFQALLRCSCGFYLLLFHDSWLSFHICKMRVSIPVKKAFPWSLDVLRAPKATCADLV